MIKDENLSLEDKQKLAQNLVERYLRENGYQGEIPEVLLTDEAHSFTVIGIGKSFNLKGKLSKLSGTANVEGLLGEAFPMFKNILNKFELHGGFSYTQLIGAVEITNKDFLSKLEKKMEL